MPFDPKLLQQLLETFQGELEEHLESLTDQLLKLEKQDLSDDDRQETLNTAFRCAHNIKGAARGVEVEVVADIAHRLEDLFSVLRENNLAPDSESVDLAFKGIDSMRNAMSAFVAKQDLPFDLDALLDEINQAIGNFSGEAAPKEARPSEKKPEKTSSTKADKTADSKESESVEKSADDQPIEQSELVRVRSEKLVEIDALSDELQTTRLEMEDSFQQLKLMRKHAEAVVGSWQRLVSLASREDSLEKLAAIKKCLEDGVDDVTEIDQMSHQLYQHLHVSSNQMNIISGALQHNIRMMRLVPIGTLFHPMVRTVRDLSREMNKPIDLIVSGEEIEVDRSILDLAKDPLIHLLRNAVDHGIEEAEERKAQGKPELATINLSAYAEGDHIMIEVKDDGAGINLDRIAELVVERKLVTKEECQELSEDELLDFIFRPGFSTKEIITTTSGRGVGLDVVRTNLQMIKGQIKVKSEPGQGTTFILQLPLTLATDRGTLMRAAGQVFAVPTISVRRVLELKASDVAAIEGDQAVIVDDQPVILRHLAAVLDLPFRGLVDRETLTIAVITRGWTSVALMVDEIVGEREIVVKHLQAPLKSVPNIAGATLTGRGEVVIVLNPANLVDSALLAHPGLKLEVEEKIEVTGSSDTGMPKVLVVDDSITTRTLEVNILRANQYNVTSAVNGREAWALLQEESFDLVVTDLVMPEMDGFELTKRIKGNEQIKEMPVVIVSSLANDVDRKRGVEVGADAYVVKSEFETRALLDILEQLL